MNNDTSFRRFAAIAAIISAPVWLSSFPFVFLALGPNIDQFSSMVDVLVLGAPAARYMHLAWMVSDVFGLLLVAPMALYLWHWLQPRNRLFVTFFALSALGYFIFGLLAVSALGGLAPPMMRAYETAGEVERAGLLAIFQSVFDLFFFGIGPLAWLFGAVWWLGTGSVLRQERRLLGIFTMIIGFLAFVTWAEQVFRIEALAAIETPFLLMVPIWSLWTGVVVWRKAEGAAPALEPVLAAG